MKTQIKSTLTLGLLLLFLITSCTPSEKKCNTNTDCVPATCCHAAEAVNKANAPDCKDLFCTLECQPGTLDCSQARMACVSGTCTVVPVEE